MNYKAISETTELPCNAVKYLAEAGVINEMLTEEDIFFMSKLAELWGNSKFIKLQVSRLNSSVRSSIVFGANLSKVESYIFTRWLHHYSTKENKTLYVSQVVDETLNYYNLPQSQKYVITKLTHKFRTKARNIIYRGGHLAEIASLLGKYKKPKRRSKSAGKSPDRAKVYENIFGS